MKYSVGMVLVAAVAATPAMADDFSGPRVEIHGGLDRLKIGGNVDGEGGTGHQTGFAYGVGAGYDWQISNFVIGVEGAADLSSTKKCVTEQFGEGETDRGCLKSGRDFELGARAGVVLGHALVYGKVAWANSRLQAHYSYTGEIEDDAIVPDATTADTEHYSTNRSGVRFGAGVQFALTQHVYVKAEYRYTDYKKFRFVDEEDVGRLHGDRNQLLGAIGFRF